MRLAFYDFAFNAFHYGHWILTGLVGVFLLYRLKNCPEGRIILWTLAAAGLFAAVHLLVRWSVRPWYAQAVFVLTLPAVALAFERTNRYLIALGAVAILFLSGWRVRAEPFRLAERSYVILHIVNNIVPPGDPVGVFNSGFVQYFTDRKVFNLDGLVNNEVLDYYRERRELDYLQEKNIGWVVDLHTYITRLFGPYWGPEAESSFVLTNVAPDINFRGNTVYAVRFLPGSPLPADGQRLDIDGFPARKSWGSVPLWPRF